MKERKKIPDFNHISNKLSDDEVQELKQYYKTYYKQKWAFTQKYKKLKQWKIIGNTACIIFGAGGIASSVATGGLDLLGISTLTLLIKAYMEHKNIDLKLHTTQMLSKVLIIFFLLLN